MFIHSEQSVTSVPPSLKHADCSTFKSQLYGFCLQHVTNGGDGDGLGEGLGDGDGLGEGLGDGDGLGEGLGEGPGPGPDPQLAFGPPIS